MTTERPPLDGLAVYADVTALCAWAGCMGAAIAGMVYPDARLAAFVLMGLGILIIAIRWYMTDGRIIGLERRRRPETPEIPEP